MREMNFSENNLRNRWLGVKDIWEQIQGEAKGFIKVGLERALVLEQSLYVGCGRYKRTKRRRCYRNGSYARDLLTRYGWIEGLLVPRVRERGFRSKVLERYRRRQRQVDRVLLEAFLLGHSTRKTRRLFLSLFGDSVSAQTISNIVKELDQGVQQFHRRPLGDDYAYASRDQFLYLDGLWITLSKPVKVKKVLSVSIKRLVALGFSVLIKRKADGSKELLRMHQEISFQLVDSESESCWWGFLSDLKCRGLKGENLSLDPSER